MLTGRNRHIRNGQALEGFVQIGEGLFQEQRPDLSPNPKRTIGLFHHNTGSGLFDRLDNGFAVKRIQGTRIDDLDLGAFLAQSLRGCERTAQHVLPGHNRHGLALAPDDCFAKGSQHLSVRYLAPHLIQQFMLKIDDRVIQSNRLLEQTLGVCRR